jgi:S1-C subfamily serine protease
VKAEKCQVGCFGRPSYDQHRSSTGLSAQTTGVVITDIEPGSQGEDAGLLKDDVIQAVNRLSVSNSNQFVRLVRALPANQLAVVLIDHADDHLYVTVRP